MSDAYRLCSMALLGITVFAGWTSGYAQSNAPAAEAGTGPEIELSPIPVPDLNALEPAVQRQLRTAQRLVEQVAEDVASSPAHRGEAFGVTGQLYHAYDFREAAKACYVNATRLMPGDFRWLYYLASLYQVSGQLDEASDAYAGALTLEPNNIAALIHSAEVLLQKNELDGAAQQFGRALALGGGAAAAAGLGEVALLQKDYPTAVQHLGSALGQVPEASRLHYLLGMAYRGMGDLDAARAHLQRRGNVGIRAADPLIDELAELRRGERVHLLQGRLAFRLGLYEEAAAEFQKAAEADPGSYRARVNFASALARLGRSEEAILLNREALEISPDGATAHFNLGFLLKRSGELDAALEHFREAVRLQEDDSRAHFELAELLRERDAYHEALFHFDRTAEIDPSDEQARLSAVQMLIELGDHAAALRRLEELHRQAPQRGRTAHALARFLAASPDTSLRDGERALEIARPVFKSTGRPSHAETVAMALAQTGRCREAAEWQRKLVADVGQTSLEEVKRLREALVRYESGPPCKPLP